MEAFSLLKYWRGGGGGSGGGTGCSLSGDGRDNVQTTGSSSTTTTTIVTAVSDQLSESEEEDGGDDGPFFDLEFTLPDETDGDEQGKGDEIEDIICVKDNEKEKDEATESDDSDDGDDNREFKLTLSSASSGDSIDPNVSVSPSDDLFFKGRLVPLAEPDCKAASPSKSTTKSTKFNVLMLKLKKSSKSNVGKREQSDESAAKNPKEAEMKIQRKNSQGKFFTVKFKVEEAPIVSYFSRDNSSKHAKIKEKKEDIDKSVEDYRGSSKYVMQRYLKKVKPLYVRVSKRYGEKLGFSGHLSLSGTMKAGLVPPSSTKMPPQAKCETESPKKVSESPQRRNLKSLIKQGSLPARLRVVGKHLGKGKPASLSTVAAPPPAITTSKRRDDSLLQQQDGIQSAIMHCKRSFKASRDMEESSLSTVDLSPEEEKAKGNTHLKGFGVEQHS